MNRQSLIAKVERLITVEDPLLTTFPPLKSHIFQLQLPNNISEEMYWYAHDVAYRAWDNESFRKGWEHTPTPNIAKWIKDTETGLLGWRAVGVLQNRNPPTEPHIQKKLLSTRGTNRTHTKEKQRKSTPFPVISVWSHTPQITSKTNPTNPTTNQTARNRST